jgi:hypothetical protein
LEQKGFDAIMSEDKNKIKSHQLEFNTYCIFTEEKLDVKETVGVIFKDYIENLKIKAK